MDNRESGAPGDDTEVVVSDVPPAHTVEPGDAEGEAGSPLPSRLTPRQRAARLVGAAAVLLLAVLALVNIVLALRAGTSTMPAHEPTPTLEPGGDEFFLLPNVPWGTVLLDGHPLTRLPFPGDAHPLRLGPGRHEFEWRAAPFLPLHCEVWVPDVLTDVCWKGDEQERTPLRLVNRGQGAIIPVHDSLEALPPDKRTTLINAIRAALVANISSAVVQTGEQYFLSVGAADPGKTVTATQPLRAMLTLQYLVNSGVPEPCIVGNAGVQPCRFPGQDCSDLCTVPTAPGASVAGALVWTAAGIGYATWDYATLDGRPVALTGDPGLNFRLVVLSITWDGAAWHVAPLFGHYPDFPAADDTVCAAARVWLARGPLADLLPEGNTNTLLQYASAPDLTEGCVVMIATRGLPAGTPALPAPVPALFLARFGTLVAANAAAHDLWSALPRADAVEAQLAQQLALQLSVGPTAT